MVQTSFAEKQKQKKKIKLKLELWVISLSHTTHLQYYDVQTLEYRYISKLPMKNEWIWSYVKETTSHLQNKLTQEHTFRGRHKEDNLTYTLKYVLYGEMGL
jgi:mitochondrial fission protein ELM1